MFNFARAFMNNTKHVNVITLFYTSLLKEKKEKLFVQLEYLTQTPFSTTPALIHPSIYSCLDPFFYLFTNQISLREVSLYQQHCILLYR